LSTQSHFLSSGDLLADRRYEYARALLAEGDEAAACDLLAQIVERTPGFGAAWYLLGDTHERNGAAALAVVAFRQALIVDPNDAHGAALRLVRLGADPGGEAMSAGYVAALFDQYAGRFDKALTKGLAYRGPALLFDAVRATCAELDRPFRFSRALDLGCGTGLAGMIFVNHAAVLEGVDLSSRMVALSQRRGCYAAVETGEMRACLAAQIAGSVDLVLAADSLVYVADLAPVFAAVAHALAPAGLFAFTLESRAEQDTDVILGETLRYAHAEVYVRRMLAGSHLRPIRIERVSTRMEAGAPVPGLLVVAQNAESPLHVREGPAGF
jgi:predicted TPR repeat methyltransferase